MGIVLAGDGVTVREVLPDTVASRAGLRAGDRIVTFGSRPVRNLSGLRRLVSSASGKVAIEVRRNRRPVTLTAEFPGKTAPGRTQREPEPARPRWY